MIKKITLGVMLLIPVIFLTGCFAVTASKVLNNSISELRYNTFENSDADNFVNFATGMREDPYELNGKTDRLIEYGVLTVTNLTKNVIKTGRYEIIINDKSYKGELELNPLNGTLVCDIKTIVKDNDEISVNLQLADKKHSYKLNNVLSETDCDYKEAISIAEKEFKKLIKEKSINGKLKGEIYIRLITGNGEIKEAKYWMINLLDNENNIFLVAINPTTRDIIAKKV